MDGRLIFHGGGITQQVGEENAIYFSERPSSGIAGWRGGWIAGIGSEGTRPALLFAGPVPERLITVAVARTSLRPAISWTSLFA